MAASKDAEPPSRLSPRNVLVTPAHTLFCAILTKTLRDWGGPFTVYRYGPTAPTDSAGGVYIRGALTEARLLDKALREADIHVVVHVLNRDSSGLESGSMSEADAFDENVRGTNSLLEALTRYRPPPPPVSSAASPEAAAAATAAAGPPVRAVLVSGDRCHVVDDVLGNTIVAAEALWLGRAMRQGWDTVVLRTPFSEPPYPSVHSTRSFIDWCFGIWDEAGFHCDDLARAVATIVDTLTGKLATTTRHSCPARFRSEALELRNDAKGARGWHSGRPPTTAEDKVAQKYGLLLEYAVDEAEEEAAEAAAEEAAEAAEGKSRMMETEAGAAADAAFELSVDVSAVLHNWSAEYGRRQVLGDLSRYGHGGPPLPSWLKQTRQTCFANNDGITAMGGSTM